MIKDSRSKKIVILAHCLLNQNSISDGTADFPSQFNDLIELLIKNNIGFIQLPCPELMCLGMERQDKDGGKRELLAENSRIRELMELEENQEKLRIHISFIISQIKEYLKHKFEIIGIIGINRSPSCGIQTTSAESKEIPGRGVFMQLLEKELENEKISLNMIGVKTGEPKESIKKIRSLFNF